MAYRPTILLRGPTYPLTDANQCVGGADIANGDIAPCTAANPTIPVPAPSRAQFSLKSPLRVRKTRQYRASEGDQPQAHAANTQSEASWLTGPQGSDSSGRAADPASRAISKHDAGMRRSQSIASASSARVCSGASVGDAQAATLSHASLVTNFSPEHGLVQQRRPSRRRALTRVIDGFAAKGKMSPARRSGLSEGGLARKWSIKVSAGILSRSRSLDATANDHSPPAGDIAKPGGEVTPHPTIGSPWSAAKHGFAMQPQPDVYRQPMRRREGRTALPVHGSPRSQPSRASNHLAPSPGRTPHAEALKSAPMVRVEPRIIPEYQCVDSDVDRSIWVAVQVQSLLAAASKQSTKKQCVAAIDLIIIIDNSQLASPSCVRSALQITRHLMSLTQEVDRFALYCTNCCHLLSHSENVTGCRLHVFGKPAPEQCEEELLAVAAAAHAPGRRVAKLADTVTSVINHLRQSNHENDACRREAHIFILSPSPIGLPPTLLGSPGFEFHFVCPSLITIPPTLLCGTLLHFSSYLHYPAPGNDPMLTFQHHLADALSAVVASARQRTTAAQVTSMQINILPGKGSQISTILGQKDHSTLLLGQSLPLLIQVRLSKFGNQRTIPREETKAQKQARELDWAFEDLESLVDIAETTMFRLEIKYKDSLFPEATEIVTSNTLCLPRKNTRTIWKDPHSPQRSTTPNGEVQGWLAYFISTLYDPKTALVKLEEHFNNLTLDEGCEKFLIALKDELEYHSNNNINSSWILPQKDEKPNPAPSSPLPRFSFEKNKVKLCGQPSGTVPILSQIASSKHSQHVTQNLSQSLSLCSLPTGSKSLAGELPNEARDRAQNIWRHMRKDSKSRRQLEQIDSKMLDENEIVEGIRRQALANKRSVGADTLRSLAMNVQGGFEAPWIG